MNFKTTQEFLNWLEVARPGSIDVMEFSGHGGRYGQTMEPDSEEASVYSGFMGFSARNDELYLNHRFADAGKLDSKWIQELDRAFSKDAKVYFYGCRTALGEDGSNLASVFSRTFGKVEVIASPEYVIYGDAYPQKGRVTTGRRRTRVTRGDNKGPACSSDTDPLGNGNSYSIITPAYGWTLFDDKIEGRFPGIREFKLKLPRSRVGQMLRLNPNV